MPCVQYALLVGDMPPASSLGAVCSDKPDGVLCGGTRLGPGLAYLAAYMASSTWTMTLSADPTCPGLAWVFWCPFQVWGSGGSGRGDKACVLPVRLPILAALPVTWSARPVGGR